MCIKVANLVLCGTALVGSLIMIPCGLKHVGIFSVILKYTSKYLRNSAATVAQLVEALCYKPAGRGFDSQWCQRIFSLT
jgi:hypothetical protein